METVDTIVPSVGVGGHHAQPRVADVAHVVLVIEVEAGKDEANARASEVDGEAVGASLAVERTTAAQGVVGRGEDAQEGGAEHTADEADEGHPVLLTESSRDAALLDALHEGVEALSAAVSGQVTIVEQAVGVDSNAHVFIAAATVAAKIAGVAGFVIAVADGDHLWLRFWFW